MIEGRFRFLRHDHWFAQEGGSTLMTDVFEFRSPFGPLGRLVDGLFLRGYLKRLLVNRNACLRQAAESDQWKQVLI
jgi:ligand-binding SRPBCC domain-containing protein